MYNNYSVQLVLQDHPTWSQNKAESVAKDAYNSACKTLMTATLATLRKLRPRASWGFYGLVANPFIGFQAPRATQINDELRWLWAASSALFPSAYVPSHDAAVNAQSWQALSRETWRLWRNIPCNTPGYRSPIYPYMWADIDAPPFNITEHLTLAEINATFGSAARQGFDGTIVWGGSMDTKPSKLGICNPWLNDWVQRVFGPFVKKLTRSSWDCASTRCSGNGRCVYEGGGAVAAACICTKGWTGSHCDASVSL